MATVDDDGYLRGPVGPTSNRRRLGKQVVQTKPGKGNVKQNESTKQAATTFGIASAFAAKVRTSLRELYFTSDGKMINRLNKMMGLIIARHRKADTGRIELKSKAFKSLQYFEMNVNSPLRENLWILPEIKLEDGNLNILLPEINVKEDLYFPVGGNSCTICIEIAIAALYHGLYRRPDDQSSIMFDVSRDAVTIPAQQWTIEVPAGCYCVTAMALHYYNNRRLKISLNSEQCSPAMICDFSIHEGEFTKTKGRYWISTPVYFNSKIKIQESPPEEDAES